MPQTSTESLLAVGQQIAGCRVLGFLGAGGMGQVYKCEHLRLQKPVALKILPALDQGSIKRFLREARSAAKIEHANVVFIHDVDQDPVTKLYFIIMQLIAGRNLAELVTANGRPIPWRQALKLMRGAAKGAGAVHAQGLVHRDIKPANIMFSTATRQAVLMDFGLVREIEPTDPQFTVGAAGTPVYMSPEQCRGSADLDPRSDIVSLGRTLYFLLTARQPYGRTDPNKSGTLDIMDQIVSGRSPTPIQKLNPSVPVEVCRLVERAMAHERERRYQSAQAMVAELDQLQKLSDLPETASYHSTPADPGAETINNLPELELITDGSADDGRGPKKWLAIACGALSVCVLVLLAWVLNRPPSKENEETGGAKSPKAAGTKAEEAAGSKPDTIKMVRIPAGTVHLGCSEAELRKHASDMRFDINLANDFVTNGMFEPESSVEVSVFWIDKYEVTNGEYAKFVQQTKRDPPISWNGDQPPGNLVDHPVVNVSHRDALAYAAWAKKKLPTEAQWVRAFRGGSKDLFPWGNTWDASRANVLENPLFPITSSNTATPKDVSRFGVFNLVGNAEEMLRDLRSSNATNGIQCVVTRGTYWGGRGAFYGTAAFPFYYRIGAEAKDSTGFRCVVEE